jgi:predicted enzyme related to lactoylglutathione lyase
MSETTDYPTGSLCHMEVPAPDLEKAKTFYEGVFGWECRPMGEGYLLFAMPGGGGGGLDQAAAVGDGGCVLVLACEDIDAKLEEIGAAGGETIQGKTEIGEGHGHYAYFRDPNGNKMGIWTPA